VHERDAVLCGVRGATAGMRYGSFVPGGADAATRDLWVAVERDVLRCGKCHPACLCACGAGAVVDESAEAGARAANMP
jgi:hypothetical protein